MIPNSPIMDQVGKISLFDSVVLPYNEVSIDQKVKIVQLDPKWTNLVSFDWKFFPDQNNTIFDPKWFKIKNL